MVKRTNLIIDFELLKEAKKILEADTFSAAVNEALSEVIRLSRLRTLSSFFGKDVWSGDLASMREDRVDASTRRKTRKKAS